LAIADLSGANPNAFYEIGIRHMAQKPIIHMQLASEKTPFDVSLYRAIKFSLAKPRDLDAAREALKKHIEAVHADGYQVENPVTNARGAVKLQEHATPEQQVLLQQLESVNRRLAQIEQSISPSPQARSSKPAGEDYVIMLSPNIPDQVINEITRILSRMGAREDLVKPDARVVVYIHEGNRPLLDKLHREYPEFVSFMASDF
jgi:hypothetical protein